MADDNKGKEILEKALAQLEHAETEHKKESVSYLQSLIQVAFAYQYTKQPQEAEKTFHDALELFKASTFNSLLNGIASHLWNYLRHVPATERDKTFQYLWQASELKLVYSDVDRHLRFAADFLCRPDGEPNHRMEKDFWFQIIQKREAQCGKNARNLRTILNFYQSACEALGELEEAERVAIRVTDLSKGQDIYAELSSQINLITFYLRHQEYAKAEALWQKNMNRFPEIHSQGVARAFIPLIEIYRNKDRSKEVSTLQNLLLEKCDELTLPVLDEMLLKYFNFHLESGKIEKARELIEARLRKATFSVKDQTARDWLLRLSDCHLALGQNEESERLFQKYLNLTTPAGKPLSLVLQQRGTLLANLGRKREAQIFKEKYSLP